MRVLTPQAHGLFDIYAIFLFFMAPVFFGITGEPRWILWTLGLVHLLVVCSTKFYYGIVKVIPMQMHGFIELAVGILLPFVPLIFGFSHLPNERHLFVGAGFALLVVWFVTDYGYPGQAWTKGSEIQPVGHHHHSHSHNGHSHSH